MDLLFRLSQVRSEEVDRELLQTGWIVEVVHFSDELCVVIVILYLQVGRSFFVNTLQHLNRIGREHMGVFR